MEETTKNTQEKELKQDEGTASDLEENFYWDAVDQDQTKINEAINNSTTLVAAAEVDAEEKPKIYGKVHSKNSAFFRVFVGDASTTIDGIEYKFELSVGAVNQSPIIICKNNNQSFTLKWNDILKMAIDAGILKENVEVKKYDKPI